MSEEIRRGRDLVGLPVYSVQEGIRVGEVAALLVRATDATVPVVGIACPEGLHYLPYTQFHAIGPDAAMLESQTLLAGALAPGELEGLETDLVGRPVVTEAGKKLGVVAGFRVHTLTGQIETYLVRPDAGGLAQVAALLSGDRVEISPEEVVTVGADGILVREPSPPPTPPAPLPFA